MEESIGKNDEDDKREITENNEENKGNNKSLENEKHFLGEGRNRWSNFY